MNQVKQIGCSNSKLVVRLDIIIFNRRVCFPSYIDVTNIKNCLKV